MRILFLMTLAVILGACSLPEKNIYTELRINASADKIWKVLSNNSGYPNWNPYHVSVVGKLSEGETLHVEIHKPNGNIVKIAPVVQEIVENKKLVWGGGINGIFTGRHVFELIPISATQTKLIHKEKFAGLAIPFAELGTIEEGYRLMNLALKQKIEGNI